MPDGSEFHTVGAATLKPREAKVVRTRGTDSICVCVSVCLSVCLCQVLSEIEVHRHVTTGTLDSGSVMSKTIRLLSSLPGRQHPYIDVLLSQSMVSLH